MIIEKLPPCPFCGSDKVEVISKRVSYVACSNCEAEGPTDYDRDKAIELWNTRLTYDDYLSNQEEVQPAL